MWLLQRNKTINNISYINELNNSKKENAPEKELFVLKKCTE